LWERILVVALVAAKVPQPMNRRAAQLPPGEGPVGVSEPWAGQEGGELMELMAY